MDPRVENTAKPHRKLAKLLESEIIVTSLKETKIYFIIYVFCSTLFVVDCNRRQKSDQDCMIFALSYSDLPDEVLIVFVVATQSYRYTRTHNTAIKDLSCSSSPNLNVMQISVLLCITAYTFKSKNIYDNTIYRSLAEF